MRALSTSCDVSRRGFLRVSAASAVALTGVARAGVQQEPDPARDFLTPESQKAVERGLAYLALAQHDDGGFGDRPQYYGNVAVTSLCGLAFMAGGHQPGRGPYGRTVTRALQYVLGRESQTQPGFLYQPTGSSHGPMYSHGFGTLLLAEAHGMVADRELRTRLRDCLKRAVDLIVATQNSEGGWRYQPTPKQAADISVTIAQIMALRAARNAGLDVPKSTVDKCIDYVHACQTPDGGFRYFKQGGAPDFARSAAGVVALNCAGVYRENDKDRSVERGLKYLTQFKANAPFVVRRGSVEIHYYYGHYYAAQAMWTAGEPYWSEWFPGVRDELVERSRRRADGAWNDPTICADYATAMACIVLQIPYNYLPILQK